MNVRQNTQYENALSRTWLNQFNISCTCDWGEEDAHQQCERGGDVSKNILMLSWCRVAVIGGQQEVFLHNVSFAEVVAPQVLCGQEGDRLAQRWHTLFVQLRLWRSSISTRRWTNDLQPVTCDDATGQTGYAVDLGEVVGVEVFVAGGVEVWCVTEMNPNAGGVQQRRTEGGVKGRAHGAVF